MGDVPRLCVHWVTQFAVSASMLLSYLLTKFRLWAPNLNLLQCPQSMCHPPSPQHDLSLPRMRTIEVSWYSICGQDDSLSGSCPDVSELHEHHWDTGLTVEIDRFGFKSQLHWASQMVLVVKNLPANAGDVRDTGSIPGLRRSPGGGHGNPTPVILAWRSPWTEEPGRMQSMGSKREGGGRGDRDGEYMYIHGWFMSMYDKNHYNILK